MAISAITILAHWAATTSDRHGDVAYTRGRNAVIDTIACLIAGAHDAASIAARDAVAGWGEGAATVVGTQQRRAAPWAALANGTAANALDYDDYDVPAASHPSAAILPALFALGEERGLSGRALLDAYIVGLEVQMRIGEAINMSHFHKGFHATATIGTLAASVACARLMGLDPQATGHALAIATSLAAGYKCQLGTTTIHLHTGLAAHNGILASALAAAGATGASDALDGNWSTLSLLAEIDAPGFEGPLAKLGNPLAIEEYGLYVKPYPCCSYATAAIDGLLALRAEHCITADDVAGITIAIPHRNIEVLKFPVPRDELEARFSMEYCIATAILNGAVTVADFSPEAVARADVRALLPRIRMSPLAAPEVSVAAVHPQPETVTIQLTDGCELTKTMTQVRGSPALPLNEAELMAKFDACVSGFLDPTDRVSLKTALMKLDVLDDIRDITRHLSITMHANSAE